MGRRLSALETLSGNLDRLVGRGPEQQGSSSIAPAAGVDSKTITNWREGRYGPKGPTLTSVEKVARHFGMEVWQILLPGQDQEAAKLVRAYATASPEWRETIAGVARAALEDAATRGGKKSNQA